MRSEGQHRGLLLRSFALLYVGLLILLPIFAVGVKTFSTSPAKVLHELFTPVALASLRLTIFTAFAMVVVNVVTGTATAWVLVRYRFPGRKVLDSLVDLPFAIPTVVTGIMLAALYGPRSVVGRVLGRYGIEMVYSRVGIVLALLFVTFPFVVRSVQPVLMAWEKEAEEAAQTLGASPFQVFAKVILPALRPSILTGAALSFSRALGEFGSIVVLAGNIPFKTQVAAVYVYGEMESSNLEGALGVSLALLLFSFLILLLLNLLQRWSHRYE